MRTRPQTSETATTRAEGASHVFEDVTAEAAIARVHGELGEGARIIEARRVLRGGLGGFFAREVVQLHAAPPGADAPTADTPTSDPDVALATVGAASGDTATADGVERGDIGGVPVDRLLQGADEVGDEVDFATFLRRQLDGRRGGAAAASTSASASASPATGPAPPRVTATPVTPFDAVAQHADPSRVWSSTVLLRLGVPAAFVHSLKVPEPFDDTAWTGAVAAALRPLCRPLPTGPAVLAGPRAGELAGATGVPVARSERFRTAMRAQRWVHLVVGGPRWRDALADDPLAVSFTRVSDLPAALACATDLGLVLGYGPVDGGVRRVGPVDAAVALRSLVHAVARRGGAR